MFAPVREDRKPKKGDKWGDGAYKGEDGSKKRPCRKICFIGLVFSKVSKLFKVLNILSISWFKSSLITKEIIRKVKPKKIHRRAPVGKEGL